MFCQLVYLRGCLPGRIRRTLEELPETLDETYARTLKEIDKKNWEYAHRLFQCVAAASRPLLIDELAEFLAFDFEAGSTPTFLADWRPEDPAHAVLSICSSLLAVVKQDYGPPVVQFAHFSVKEFLTSARLAEAKDSISRFHVSMTAAHTIIAQACLGVLLHLDEVVTRGTLKKFPLAKYAAEHWVGHARSENVSGNVEDGMKRLFDPSESHLSVWVWARDPESRRHRSWRFERREKARATPLHYAAFCGLHDIAAFLIVEHSQDVNARGFDEGETPLHVASRCGHADIAQLLLEHGADAESQDDNKRTPLILASQVGVWEVARVLLEHGADVEAQDRNFCSPLKWASDEGHAEVAQILLEHGADANAQAEDDKSTPLHFAQGEVVARVLIKHGADANAVDINCRTPLHIASGNGRVGVARVLLEHGADANSRDASNMTPLHFSSKNGRVRVAWVLFEHGADANFRDASSMTPLHLASKNGCVGAARVLLERGADANSRDATNMTPLHLASRNGHVGAARVLLEHGADANSRDATNMTPLHFASRHGRMGVTRVLFEHGADANSQDASNRTPLHLASSPTYINAQFPDVVQLLLQYNSDVHARDNKGRTAFMRANATGHRDIMQVLLEYGAEDTNLDLV